MHERATARRAAAARAARRCAASADRYRPGAGERRYRSRRWTKLRLGGMALAERRARPRADVVGVRRPDYPTARSRWRPALKRVSRLDGAQSASCAGPRGSPRLSRSCREVKRRLPEARLPFERPRVSPPRSVARLAGAGRSAVRHLRRRPREAVARARSPSCPAARRARAATSSRRTTAPSTSRSARTSTGERAPEGARALRLAPRRPAAPHDGARGTPSPRRAPRAPPAALPVWPRPRRRRSRGRGLRLDGPPSRQPALPRAREARSRAPAPALDERADRDAQLEVAEAALRACLELEGHGA